MRNSLFAIALASLLMLSCNQRKIKDNNLSLSSKEQTSPQPKIEATSSDDFILHYLTEAKITSEREKAIRITLSLIDILSKKGDLKSAERIYAIFKRVYPNEIPLKYLLKKPIAELNNVKSFTDTATYFTLNQDENVHIYGTGEGVYNIESSIIPPWFDDNVEIFFDMRNNKSPYFDRNGDDRQYFFTWDKKEVGGQNIATKGLEFKQADPSPHSYTMEIKIPWHTLGYTQPKHGASIGFDIMIDDDDKSDLESQTTWHSKSGMLSSKTSLFGTLVLDSLMISTPVSNDTAFAGKTNVTPIIDGVEDHCWLKATSYPIKQLVGGAIDGPDDISGIFKVLWDSNNFYLLVKVKDDKKIQASAIFDYGWIENNKGDTVWMMDVKKTKHAGGAIKNRGVDTLLHLKAGRYKLHYMTDNSHAYGDWDDTPPETSLYGIVLYRDGKKD